MSTKHDSYNRSPHGCFARSGHGWRGGLGGYVVVGGLSENKNIWIYNDELEAQQSYLVGGLSLQTVAADANGFVVGGSPYGGDASVWHFNAAGSVDWTYDTGDAVYGTALDPSGNVYVCGQSFGEGPTIWKLSKTGAVLWSYDTREAGASNSVVFGLAVSQSGYIYACGSSKWWSGELYPPPQHTLWKLGSDGSLAWATTHDQERPYSVCEDAPGNVYMAGQMAYSYLVQKFASSGAYLGGFLYSDVYDRSAFAAVRSEGGSIHAMNVNSCLAELTRNRVIELQNHLACGKGADEQSALDCAMPR